MMKVFIRSKKGINAVGEYNESDNSLTVLKDSIVSKNVCHSPKFQGAGTIERYREQHVVDFVVKEDILFKSPSTAANFVTGSSSNGLSVWKSEDGRSLKQVISKG